ncbi:hypothetical protein JCM14036_15140 [Desulfotomaculum defluvii]
MLRSLYSGISGMKNHQTRMDVVGNNIANVNTTGYKAGRVNFQDTLSQTTSFGGDGTNPVQVGLGSAVSSVSNNFIQGPTQNTGRTLDLAIQGNGFFVVKDKANNEFYSRDGVLFIDDNGYLVNGDGLKVQSSQGDIRVFNGPVSTISIAPNGALTGTNSAGEPLQFSSSALIIPDATEIEEARLVGGVIGEIKPIIKGTGSLQGDPISAVDNLLVEAKITGNNDPNSVEPQLATAELTDMSDPTIYGLTLAYSDGVTAIPAYTLNTNLTDVRGWPDLVTQLQAAIDDPTSPIKGLVKVSYDNSPYGGLSFETITDPDSMVGPAPGSPITPEITLGGAGVAKYMGSIAAADYTNIKGTAVDPKDWTDPERIFNIDIGNGWQEITLASTITDVGGNNYSTGLDRVTSGEDLADKLQKVFDILAGDNTATPAVEKSSIISVTWDNDHLVFRPNPADSSKTVILGGQDVTELLGKASNATENSMNWSTKDLTISYNGATYSFTEYEKKAAGLDCVSDGDALAAAVKKLINTKIGSEKVDVKWSTDHLEFKTTGTTGIGVKPTVTVGGIDAGFFVGNNPEVKEGKASEQPPAPSQEPFNQIRLAAFQNPEGLIKAGGNLFQISPASGKVTYGTGNTEGFGDIKSGYLEMSNVDLAEEFTNIITTQRGYQANARVITVSDSLLEELIQLKR